MAVTYNIQGRVVRLTNAGEYTVSDIENTLGAALKDPDFPDRALLLMDVTHSTSLADRSAADIRYMSERFAKLSPRFGARLGMVAGSQLHYGMMRMAEVYSEVSGMTARVFHTAEDALEWLALDESGSASPATPPSEDVRTAPRGKLRPNGW